MERIFSIIIPVYNVKSYLASCIESVMIQSFKNYEVILVDDGSTDGSSGMCDDLYEKYPEYIKVIHQKNQGLSHARNTGIANSNGVYILFLDSDDYWQGDFLDELVKEIKQSPDIVFTNGFTYVYENDVDELYHEFKQLDFDGKNGEESLFRYIHSPRRRWAAWQHVYRRDFLLENNLFFQVGLLCEDVEWTYKVILKANKTRLFDRRFYYYRAERSGSIMNVVSYKRWSDLISICELWLSRIKTLNNDQLQNELEKIFVHLGYLNIKQVIGFDKLQLQNAKEVLMESEFFYKPFTVEDKKIKKRVDMIGFDNTVAILKRYYQIRRLLGKVYHKLFK